jgi:hypothetical protein
MASLKSRLKNSVRLPAIFGEGHAINQAVIYRGAWISLKSSVYSSTGELDEARAIDLVATYLVPLVFDTLSAEFSREWLKTALRKGLREGRPKLAALAVEAAQLGDEIAHEALCTVYADIPLAEAGMLAQHNNAFLHILSYGKRVIGRAPPKRRGRRWHDNWMRDIQICLLIAVVSRDLRLPASRNKSQFSDLSQFGDERSPSGISIVVTALNRRLKGKEKLNEAHVQDRLWFGLPGEIVRSAQAVDNSETKMFSTT